MNEADEPSIGREAPLTTLACMEVWGGAEAFEGALSTPGNDIEVVCRPHRAGPSGGDLYYLSNCAAGIITRAVLADVAGHGPEVSHIAAQLRALMRRYINTADQTRLAIALNRAFGQLGHGGRFASALLATYFAPTDHLIVCNAGHPRPLHYAAARDRWRLLALEAEGVMSDPESARRQVGVANLPLGILDSTDYPQFALRLGRGDVVVLYTDALIEAAGPGGRGLGEDGLLELAAGLNAQDRLRPATSLGRAVLAASGRRELDDDATIVALHHNAADPPPLGIRAQVTRLARVLGLNGHG